MANRTAITELDILWITAGLGCDGDTIAMTAATQPSLEDLLRGGLPWIPKLTLHNPFLSKENHLDAAMIERSLAGWTLDDLDFLLIENVGNLVCPASYDLGEDLRLVLVSVTEGEDKPLKYPTVFNSADVAVVTKTDLAAVVDCDLPALRRNIEAVRPGLPVLEVSAKTGAGLSALLAMLEARRDATTGLAATVASVIGGDAS